MTGNDTYKTACILEYIAEKHCLMFVSLMNFKSKLCVNKSGLIYTVWNKEKKRKTKGAIKYITNPFKLYR